MAFGTIAWNGEGTVSYCDGLSDSAGGTWAEDGGGGISYNTDQYITGTGSIGHVYASKSGFGSYAASTTYDFTLDSSGTGTVKVPGQKMYAWVNYSSSSAFDILANNGFAWIIGSDTSNHRNYKLSGSDDNNGWSTGWKLFVLDPLVGDASMDVGTYDPGNVAHWGLWMDTIVSVRADTVFIDRVAIAHGLRVTDGVGTMEEIVTWCAKTLATRAWGVFQYRGRFIYSAGSLTVGDSVSQTANTQLTSSGSKIGYEISEYYHDTNGWSLTHGADYNQIDLEKHASYTTDYTATNTGMYGDTTATLSITNDVGATLNHTGGELEELSAIVMNSDQAVENVVLSDCSTRSINGAVFDNNTVNTSDTITASASGSFTGNTVSKSIGAVSVVTADLNHAPSNTFISDGSNHAVELTGATTSATWSCSTSGYAVGATGSPITPTATGNEDLYITATSSSDITINVAAGATTPSVRVAASFTGNVIVVAGLITLTISTQDGNEVRIRQGSYTIQHTQNVTGGQTTYTYTYVAGTKVTISVGAAGFERQTLNYGLLESDTTLLFTLVASNSYI